MAVKIEPLRDRVLVKLTTETRTESGLYLPEDRVMEETMRTGTVLAIGPKVETVKIGQTVLFQSASIMGMLVNKDGLVMLQEHMLEAILTPPPPK